MGKIRLSLKCNFFLKSESISKICRDWTTMKKYRTPTLKLKQFFKSFKGYQVSLLKKFFWFYLFKFIFIGQSYLDHAGGTLYSEQQLQKILSSFQKSVYCNPHTNKSSEDAIDQVRFR